MTDTDRETASQLMVRFDDRGLVPAIVQDAESGQILMFAWMNDQALAHTLQTRKATFYSRSRGKIWVKGESSGHVQRIVEIRTDCDQDVILLRVRSNGPACHAGYNTCFYRAVDAETDPHAPALRFVESRVFDPAKVYGG